MLEVEVRDGIAVVRMVHGKANALDLELCDAAQREFDHLEHSSARAVVLTGQGKIFSAGVDLLRVLEEGPEYIRQFLRALSSFCESIFSFSKPLIVAINGHAVAGGCVLVCMADRRIMARGAARIGVPELHVGVPFPTAPLEILRFALPNRYFLRMLYTGATYEPEAALERGLIHELVEPKQLLDRAVAVARDFGSLSPKIFKLTKEQIRKPALDQIRAGRRDMDAVVEEIWTSPETLQAIRDYVSKTFKRGE